MSLSNEDVKAFRDSFSSLDFKYDNLKDFFRDSATTNEMKDFLKICQENFPSNTTIKINESDNSNLDFANLNKHDSKVLAEFLRKIKESNEEKSGFPLISFKEFKEFGNKNNFSNINSYVIKYIQEKNKGKINNEYMLEQLEKVKKNTFSFYNKK